MENGGRLTSGFHAAPALGAAQSLPDGYSKKGASYRRPIAAQPAPAQPQVPVAADTLPNSLRAGAPPPAPNGVSRTSSHRRRQSQQIPPPQAGEAIELLPTAPDVPRGPPTSYRDPYAPKGSSRGPSRSYSGRSRDPTIQMNASRQQPNVTIPAERLQQLRAPPYAPVEPLTGTVEGGSRRESQGRRPSVPDRSPLQKLEGKLDDISKEERRARILEMELAAQEKAEADMRARRAREATAKQQRVVSGPTGASEQLSSGPTRTASSRRHVSMPVQPVRAPVDDHLSESEDGYEYDLSEPWDPAAGKRASGIYRAPSGAKGQRSSLGSQHQKHAKPTDATVGRTPSTKGKEPIGVSRGSGSFKDRAGDDRGLNGAQPPVHKIERKPITVPTGLGLYGVDDPIHGSSVSGVYDSRGLSKELPPTPRNVTQQNDGRRDSRGIYEAQMEMERQRLDRKNEMRGPDGTTVHSPVPISANTRRGVGFADSVPDPTLEEEERSHDQRDVPDVFSHNHNPDRRYVPPPMLEEWRNAPIATLVEDDLDLEAVPVKSNSTNKTWWEENSSSRRRRSSGYAEPSYDGYVDTPSAQTTFNPPLHLKCGPLLRYTGLRKDRSRLGKDREVWRGSVMIVTTDAQSSYQKPPTLRMFKQPMDLHAPPPVDVDDELDPAHIDPLEGQIKVSRTGRTLYAKPIEDIPEDADLSRIEDDTGLFQEIQAPGSQKSSRIRKKDGEKLGKVREIPGVRLHAERGVTFWRFNIEVELAATQTRIGYRINRGPAIGFWVPARGETMNIMFHSCNGFSLSVSTLR